MPRASSVSSGPADLSGWVGSLTDFEKDLGGLGQDFAARFRLFRAFVRRSSDPWKAFPSIHIAGSKGKGSVGHALSALLSTRLRKVGLFTSPHLLDVTERIRINGRPIGRKAFLAYADRVRRTAGREGARLSYFEFLTYLSFLYFRDEKVDLAVYEAGLGGRLDATNVIVPAASVLTSIEKEHTDILGGTIGKIAKEKLGILKKGVPVFSLGQEEEVRTLARSAADRLSCRLFEEGIAFTGRPGNLDRRGREFFYRDVIDNRETAFRVAAAVPVQVRNVSLALFIGRWLFPGFDLRAAGRVLKGFSVPGRFELVRRSPVVIFDPCHTVASFEALLAALKERYSPARTVLYVSLFRDKDVRGILALLGRSGVGRIVWLDNPNPRSVGHREAARMAAGLESMPLESLSGRIGALRKDRVHVFAGSFSIYRFIKIS